MISMVEESNNKSKCGRGTHYDAETNSCILDEE